MSDALRTLPAVATLLGHPTLQPLIAEHGRVLVTEAVRRAIADARGRIRAGEHPTVGPEDVSRAVRVLATRSLRQAINGTGVVIHTNLGRAPLADAARIAIDEIASGYSTTELDVAQGARGSRHDHVRALITQLVGAEDGIAVNNCAGAVLLMLAALCRDREVLVARGELVEIGGGFRVPDVMRESGARLVEVGTTNKVHIHDYKNALSEEAGAILRVHRSNFAIVGFTAQPSIEELADVARSAGVPLLVDLGSGLLARGEQAGSAVRDEPRPDEILARGADIVAFSGDKLLGGPQAGIIAGRTDLMARLEKHPLARALRAGKLTLAGLEATLRLYRDGRADEIPVIEMLNVDDNTLDHRAESLRSTIFEACPDLACDVVPGDAVVGGGALPLARLSTRVVLIGRPGGEARRLAALLRRTDPPLITRMVDDRVAIDTRTVRDSEIAVISRLVAAVWTEPEIGEVY